MLTFLAILSSLLLLNVLIFLFSRNSIKDTSAPEGKKAHYEREVKKIKHQISTTPQFQDA